MLYFIILLIFRIILAVAKPGYFDYDSYHYLKGCSENIVFCHISAWEIILVNVIAFAVLYYLMAYLFGKYNVPYAKQYAMLFFMLPLVYLNTSLDSLDKNMVTLLFATLIYIILMKAEREGWNWFLLVLISCTVIVASFFWSAFPFMVLIIVLEIAFYFAVLKKKYLFGGLFFVLGIIAMFFIVKMFPELIPGSTATLIISELFPAWKVFPYFCFVIMLVAFIMALLNKNPDTMDFLAIITIPMTFMIFRLNIFALIPSFLVFFKNWNFKHYFGNVTMIIIMLLAIFHGIDVYGHQIQNDSIEELVKYSSKDCIVADFGYGHYLKTLNNKTVLFLAHPQPLLFLDNFYKDSNCSIIWNDKALKVAEYWKNVLNYDPTGNFAQDNIVAVSKGWKLSESHMGKITNESETK